MLRKILLLIVAMSLLVVAAGALAFPPQKWERKEIDSEGKPYTETYERTWSLLPREQWEFSSVDWQFCGYSGGGGRERRWRIGFVGLREVQMTVRPLKRVQLPKSKSE